MRHVAFRQFVAGTDVHALDMLISEPGAIYVMDRGYIDFARLHTLHQGGAFFVTRAKSNLNAHRVYSAPTDRSSGVIADQTIALDDPRTRQDYPAHLLPRCRKGQDAYLPDQPHGVTGFDHLRPVQKPLAGGTFFKWIKQHLRIKQFFGTSENAVKTQIWIAVSVYVLVAIVRKRLKLEAPLYTLLQIISVFEKSGSRRHFPNQSTDTILHKMTTNWSCLAFNRTAVTCQVVLISNVNYQRTTTRPPPPVAPLKAVLPVAPVPAPAAPPPGKLPLFPVVPLF